MTGGRRRTGEAQPSYPAREVYRRGDEAAGYDAARFRSARGRLVAGRERALIARALARCGAPLASIIDLPAGTGRLGALLAAGDRLVVGADRSRPMLAQAAAYRTRRVVADAAALPFADHAFDAVVSLRFTGHLPPAVRRRVLSEMARVARRRLVVAFYDATPVTRCRRLLRRLTGRAGSGVWFAQPIARTRRELEAQGFRILDARPLARWVSETWVLVLEPPPPREPT